MCKVHWYMVPSGLIKAVWRAYHKRAKDPEGLRRAQRAAILAVEEKLKAEGQ